MSLYQWDGTQFVAITDLHVWDGAAMVRPESAWIWDGTEFVRVWPAPIVFVTSAAVSGSYTGSMSVTVPAGTYIVLDVWTSYTGSFTRTYNGVAMTALYDSGNFHRFGYLDTVGGTRTVSIDGGSNAWFAAAVTCYQNVGSVGATTVTAVGSNVTSMSQGPISVPANSLVVQAFLQSTAAKATALSGGINRVNFGVGDPGYGGLVGAVVVNDSDTGPVTFTGTAGGNTNYRGVATVLNPG